MKTFVRVGGILCLICGIILALIGSEIKQDVQPREYSSGVIINGVYTETDREYTGGNEDMSDGMEILMYLGCGIALVGAVATIASFLMKENKCDY